MGTWGVGDTSKEKMLGKGLEMSRETWKTGEVKGLKTFRLSSHLLSFHLEIEKQGPLSRKKNALDSCALSVCLGLKWKDCTLCEF